MVNGPRWGLKGNAVKIGNSSRCCESQHLSIMVLNPCHCILTGRLQFPG